jgi:tetratricopeptide (TPR) repeat protein
MAKTDALAEFKLGVDLLQNGKAASAIEYFRSAVEADTRNPYYLSFLGLSVARVYRQSAAAPRLCEAALHVKPDELQFYLNLAEVYLAGSRRDEAIQILDSALKRFGSNAPLKRESSGAEKQSRKVLPFISRYRATARLRPEEA